MSIKTINELLKKIDEIDKISNETWKASLNDRKLKELEFHDKDRDVSVVKKTKRNDTYEKFYGNKKYYVTTKRSNDFSKNWISTESKGKIFLDYACGNGSYAILASQSGASLSLGFDISGVSVINAENEAKRLGLKLNQADGIRFFQADAENTKLPDNCIDRLVCSGMLHHLDLSYAFPELRRILKPGGKILAIEALDINPLIKLYRFLTPDMRTEWEKAHILSLKDIKFASHFFEIEQISYWHVCGYLGGKFSVLFPILDIIDHVLEKIPLVQKLSWIFTFILRKEK